MAKGRRTDRDIVDAIHELALEGRYSPAEIHRRIIEKFGPAAAPVLRTVENIAREVTPRDTSEAWRLAGSPTNPPADPDDAAILLPVLGEVCEATAGQVQSVTRREAEWIVRLRRTVADLPGWDAYLLARDYLARVERNEDTADLDQFLVSAPWRPGNAMRYIEAAREGRTPGGRIVHNERVVAYIRADLERREEAAERKHAEEFRGAIEAYYQSQPTAGTAEPTVAPEKGTDQ